MKPCFFDFDSVVYDTLLEYLLDSEVSSLSQADKSTYRRVSEHTQTRVYWLKRLPRRGIREVPSHVDPFLLYKDVFRSRHAPIRNIIRYMNDTLPDKELESFLTRCIDKSLQYLVKLVLQKKQLSRYDIYKMCTSKNTEMLRLVLDDPRLDRIECHGDAIILASERGCTEAVRMLLEDGRGDPSVHDNQAMKLASKYGYTEVVRLLEQDARVRDKM